MNATALLLALALARPNPTQAASGYVITEIFSRDVKGHSGTVWGLAVDANGNVYAGGSSKRVHRITPDGSIDLLMDSSGDGNGSEHNYTSAIAIYHTDILVAGEVSNNVHRIVNLCQSSYQIEHLVSMQVHGQGALVPISGPRAFDLVGSCPNQPTTPLDVMT